MEGKDAFESKSTERKKIYGFYRILTERRKFMDFTEY